MTEFVDVKHKDAPEGAPTGKIPARSLAHWQDKGYVQVGADPEPIPVVAATTEPAPAETSTAVALDGDHPGDPVSSTDGTAAGSADDTQRTRRTPGTR